MVIKIRNYDGYVVYEKYFSEDVTNINATLISVLLNVNIFSGDTIEILEG